MSTSVRRPAVAGSFYPAGPVQLEKMVDNFLKPDSMTQGRPRILIVPHAGYVYSGAVAGAAFATASEFDTVLLLGVSHHYHFSDACLSAATVWQTPLGEILLNQDVIARLLEHHPIFVVNEGVHRPEHGLEVELPFLQRQLPECTIIPILLSRLSADALQHVCDGIFKVADDKTLIVISSDLSHYPAPEDAERVDAATIQAIVDNDLVALEEQLQIPGRHTVSGLVTSACGALAIKGGMQIAEAWGLGKGQLLRYANSGTPSGAVGYAAIAYFS